MGHKLKYKLGKKFLKKVFKDVMETQNIINEIKFKGLKGKKKYKGKSSELKKSAKKAIGKTIKKVSKKAIGKTIKKVSKKAVKGVYMGMMGVMEMETDEFDDM